MGHLNSATPEQWALGRALSRLAYEAPNELHEPEAYARYQAEVLEPIREQIRAAAEPNVTIR